MTSIREEKTQKRQQVFIEAFEQLHECVDFDSARRSVKLLRPLLDRMSCEDVDVLHERFAKEYGPEKMRRTRKQKTRALMKTVIFWLSMNALKKEFYDREMSEDELLAFLKKCPTRTLAVFLNWGLGNTVEVDTKSALIRKYFTRRDLERAVLFFFIAGDYPSYDLEY